jgi:hypothetical protein
MVYMSLPIINPNALIDKLKNTMIGPFVTGESVLVIEASRQVFRLIELSCNAFCDFKLEVDTPIPNATRALHRENGPALYTAIDCALNSVINRNHSRTYRDAFLLGELADDHQLRQVLENKFKVLFNNLNLHGEPCSLPTTQVLRQELEAFPCETPHRLKLLYADLNLSNDGLEILDYELYRSGLSVEPNVPLGQVELIPPTLNEDFIVVFEEEPDDPDFAPRGVYYCLHASKPRFTLSVYFDENARDWRVRTDPSEAIIAPPNNLLRWDGEPVITRPRDTPPLPPMIEVREAYPNLVIAIESTLGMQRAYYEATNAEVSEKATNFNVIVDMCRSVIQSLYPIDDLRYLLMLYGGHRPSPPEFRNLSLKSARPVVVHLPFIDRRNPEFVNVDRIELEVDQRLPSAQTATSTWHKSVDEALHYLNNNISWDEAARLVLWIAQAPPFPYSENDEVPIDTPGFVGKHNMRQELRELVGEKNVRNIVLFINGEFEQPPFDKLYDEARNAWLEIVDGDESRIFERSAANEPDSQLGMNLAGLLEVEAPLQSVPIIINRSNQRLYIPLLYDVARPIKYVETANQ